MPESERIIPPRIYIAGAYVRPILRRRDIIRLFGIGSSTLDDWIRTGHFPKPRKLSGQVWTWEAREIAEWYESRKVGD